MCYKNGVRKCFIRLFRRVRWNVSSTTNFIIIKIISIMYRHRHRHLSSNSSVFLRKNSFQEVQKAHGDLRDGDQVETGEETNVSEYDADEDVEIENR